MEEDKVTRVCASCKKEKRLEEYNKNAAQPLGRSHYCKDCSRIPKYSDKSSERYRDLVGYKFNNLEVIERIGPKNYNGCTKTMWLCLCKCGSTTQMYTSQIKKHKYTTCGCERHAKSAENSKRSRHKIAKKDAISRGAYGTYKCMASKRNLNFELSFEEFKKIIKQNCHYCGCEPVEKFRKANFYSEKMNGVDRVDNTKGYVLDNCVPCCTTCNIAKNNQTKDEFLSWVKNLCKNLFKDE